MCNEEITLGAVATNENLINLLVLDHYREMLTYCRRKYGIELEESENIVNEVFEQLIRVVREVRKPETPVVPWLYQYLNYKCKNYKKSGGKRFRLPFRRNQPQNGEADFLEDSYPSDIPTPEKIVLRKEFQRCLVECISQLVSPFKEIAELFFFEGLKPKRIAKEVGAKNGKEVSDKFLRKIRFQLQECLKRYGFDKQALDI